MKDEADEDSIERVERCPLCGGTSWINLALPGRWIGPEVFAPLAGRIGLVRCRDCRLRFVHPRPATDRLSAFYSGETYSCHEPSCSASAGSKADLILDRLAACLPSKAPRRLVDYGAGGGFLVSAEKRGWDARGFEPGQRGFQACQQANLNVCDNAQDLPAGEAGLVTMHHVLEHLADPLNILREIRALLADGGRLFIEVPNVASLRARLAVPFLTQRFAIDERHRAYPIHLMYYCDGTLRRMLETAGWTVELTFTLGMGLDEYFLRRPSSDDEPTSPDGRTRQSRGVTRRLKHGIRDGLHHMGLGENLAIVARTR